MFSKFAIIAVAAILACALLVSADSIADHQILATDEAVAAINKIPNLSWHASKDQGVRVNGATVADLKRLMGVSAGKPKSRPVRRTYSAAEKVAAPASYEAYNGFPQCENIILNIRDQSACGSCWATAAAEAISDRYCTYGKHNYFPVSNADIMECCWYCGSGCGGGQPADAWAFWVKEGLVSEACQPYPFPKCEHHVHPAHARYPPCPKQEYPTPSCPGDRCSGNSTGNNTIYRGSNSWTLYGVEDYQQELVKNGPFEVAFTVYADFPLYKGGVYRRTSNQVLGGHAVKILGWGEENGTPYWMIANSWNADWGTECGPGKTKGCFKILRGVNECGIEEAGSAGAP